MTHSLFAFAGILFPKGSFESSPALFELGEPQSHLSLVSLSPLQTLRKVSGRLSQLLHRRDKGPEPKRRLLVVDDEESICFSMQEYFTHHGYLVETARDVDQAEKLISAGNYEVIIQDLRLGTTKNSDGLDIIRLVHDCCPQTRIIVLTAYGSSEVELQAKASGADAFLSKPQPLSQVAQVVRGLIESPRRWVTPNA